MKIPVKSSHPTHAMKSHNVFEEKYSCVLKHCFCPQVMIWKGTDKISEQSTREIPIAGQLEGIKKKFDRGPNTKSSTELGTKQILWGII